MLKRLLAKLIGRLGYVVKRRRTGISRANGKVLTNLAPADLMTALHRGSVYDGFDFENYPNDPAGWGGTSPAFAELITETRPKFIIEVGTWKESSAITMADLLTEQGEDGIILCIDTWLGAIEFWCNQADPAQWQVPLGPQTTRYSLTRKLSRFNVNVCKARNTYKTCLLL